MTSTTRAETRGGNWPLERMLFAIAGTFVLLGSALAAFVSPWFLLLTVFVAVNQWLYVLAGNCGMSLFLERVLGVRRGIER